MRKKTTERHKSINTFRFQGEQEKRKNIVVNAAINLRDGLHYVEGEYEADSSHLYKAICHWTELNQHSEFTRLLSEIGQEVRILPQVLHQKERLVTLLTERINTLSIPYLEAVLGLIDAVVLDLQQEFVSYLPLALNNMTELILTSNNAEVIQKCLNCYSNILKKLRSSVIKEFEKYLKIFSRLLRSDVKTYIVENACKCFEFVTSKAAKTNPIKFLDKLYRLIKSNKENLEDGIAILLYTMMASKSAYQPIKFSHCLWFINEVTQKRGQEKWEAMILSLVKKLKNVRPPSENSTSLWEDIKNSFLPNLSSTKFSYFVRVVNAMMTSDSKVPTSSVVICDAQMVVIRYIIDNSDCWTESSIVIADMINLVGILIKFDKFDTIATPLVERLVPRLDAQALLALDSLVRPHRSQYLKVIPILGQAYRNLVSVTQDNSISPLLVWYSDMLLEMDGGVDLPIAYVNHPANRFNGISLPCYYFKQNSRPHVEINDPVGLEAFLKSSCVDFINAAAMNLEILKVQEEEYLRYFLVLKQFDLSQHVFLKKSILALLNSILSLISTCGGDPTSHMFCCSLFPVLYMSLEALSRSCDHDSELILSEHKNVLELLINFCVIRDENVPGFSLWALKFLDLLLFIFRRGGCSTMNLLSKIEISSTNILRLIGNLSSGFKIVRSLTLSILQVFTTEDIDTELKGMSHIFKIALENELNEFDLVNIDHEPSYHKLEQYIRHVDGAKLKVMLKYLLGLLFQNNTKLWERTVTLVSLVSKKLGFESFWDIFSPRFTLLHTCSNIKSSILEDVDIVSSDFLNKMKVITFGFMESTSPPVGREDKLDFINYKVNLWKIILAIEPPIPTFIAKEIFLRIHDLHAITASPRPFIGVKKDSKSKAALSVLIPALEALLQCSSSQGNIELQNICLSLLPGPKLLQKPVIGILRTISPTINAFMTKMEDLGDHQWLKKVYLMSFSGSTPDFVPSDRDIFINFILRLLLSLDAETKGSSREIVNKFLCNCTEDEVRSYTSYIFGNLSDWQGLQPLPLKAITAHINNIANMLSLWRYNFPNLSTELITRVCHFVMLADQVQINNVNCQNTQEHVGGLDDNVIQHRKKAVLTAGRLCIIKFFELFESQPMREDTLNLIFQAIILSNKENFKTFASNSVSWFLQLMLIWSKNPRFHVLFTKCQNQDPETTVMHKLFDIFDSKFLKSKPRLHLIEIVSNLVEDKTKLTEDLAMEIDNDDEQKPKNVEPVECGECLHVEMKDERLGVSIVLAGRDKLFNVITDKAFFQDAIVFQNAVEKCTKFLRLFAQHSGDQKINESICSAVLEILPKFRNKQSDLIGLLELVGELLTPFQPKDSIVVKLSTCLVWTCGKGARESLCQAIVVAMKNKTHAQLIQNLNAYTNSVSDEPDFKKRQKAFEKLDSLIANCCRFKTVLFSCLTSTCFHFLTHETDTGLLLIAHTLLETIAGKLAQFAVSMDEDTEVVQDKKIHNYIETIVIPRLKAGVKSKTDAVFDNYLKVLSVFSAQCHKSHGTLKGVHAVFQQDGQDILQELQDIQLSIKARAANKFELLWPVMRSEPAAVVHFAIPILSHHLLDKTKLKVSHQNLIQCSLEALKWCTIALPHGSYFKYLESVLENMPHDEPMLLKQYHKILGNVIDGFHYELDPNYLSSVKHERPPGLNKHKDGDVKETEIVENGSNFSTEDIKGVMEENSTTDKEPSITVKLSFGESKSCLTSMTKKFIPKLRKYLHLEEKATHKLSKSTSDARSSLTTKIPTTLAYVKLLQKLPSEIRKSHMIWVIPTLCSSLNSKLISVRGNVKETLARIVQELGPDVFPDIVRSCKSYLTRGFQKHVRNHTLLYILQTLRQSFLDKPKCVPVKEILPLVEDELFGYMAEDKNVEAILSATPEAKRKNGLQLLAQCGMFVTPNDLNELLKCPVERAKTAKSLQTIVTGKQWVNEIVKGLSTNQNVKPADLLQFLWIQFESHCGVQSTPTNVPVKHSKYLFTNPDAFLLPQVNKQTAREGKQALGIVVSNFVFTTLCGLLKDDKLKAEPETLHLLDSFAKCIVDGKRDETLEIRTPSLRCLVFMFSFSLKCFEDSNFLRKMWQKYFLAVNDAFQNEEINMYYKFLTTFFATFTDHRIDLADLKLLIKCIHKHLQENKCTGSALVLLRNILHRRIKDTPDIIDLVKEVKRHIWTDCPVHIQEGCRLVYLVYVKNYMTEYNQFIEDFSTFFEKLTSSIAHSTAHSILYMISSMIQIIPKKWLSSRLRTDLTIDLTTALCKMKEPESQKLVSDSCMKNFFELLGPQEGLDTLKDLEQNYCTNEMIPFQRELCMTIRKIIEHNKCWGSEAATIKALQILSKVLEPINFTELKAITKQADLRQEYRDHGIFQGLLAVFHATDMVIPNTGTINSIADSPIFKEIEKMLKWIRTDYINYNHDWVQTTAVKCVNAHMALIVEMIGNQNVGEKTLKLDFMEPFKCEDVVLFLIRQYSDISSKTKLDDTKALILDGLVFLAILAGKQESKTFHEHLLKRIRYCVNNEIRNFPTNTVMRETMFKFCRKYISEIRDESLEIIQWPIVRMTTREITDTNCPSEIVILCKSTQESLKLRLGQNTFIQLYNQARNEYSDKRENNRAKKKEQVVITKSKGSKRKKNGGKHKSSTPTKKRRRTN